MRPVLIRAGKTGLRESSSLNGPSIFPQSKMRFVLTSGIYPKGFSATGIHCGVKKDKSLDLALIVSHSPDTVAAGVFTKNAFKAAPVQVSQKILQDTFGKGVRGVIINSGCANAVTGARGMEDAWKMSETLSQLIDSTTTLNTPNALVMSTGVIGQHLPISNITQGISPAFDKLGSTHYHWTLAAQAIMTTDTFPKLRSRQVEIPGVGLIRFAGMDKGAGMIHPNMATMLGLVCTDAKIDVESLQEALRYATDRSFNSISVDGDMSTNDTVIVMANGQSDGPIISSKGNEEAYIAFRDALTEFSIELAQLVVRDGEGATKFVAVNVCGAPSYSIAKEVASTISTSPLVKTAIYGKDANWGRILCSVGYSAAGLNGIIDPTKVNVSMKASHFILDLLQNGEPVNFDEEVASKILAHEDIEIQVDLGTGGIEKATMWTCDLSHDYVTINGSYRT